ncbi:MAG: hypothetical protein K0S37_4795 [Microbacterium sp.]|nr:hypothetical protein [Microbacterium sp.]
MIGLTLLAAVIACAGIGGIWLAVWAAFRAYQAWTWGEPYPSFAAWVFMVVMVAPAAAFALLMAVHIFARSVTAG